MDKSTMHVSVLAFSTDLQIHVFQQTMSCLHLYSHKHLKCNLPKTDHIISPLKAASLLARYPVTQARKPESF